MELGLSQSEVADQIRALAPTAKKPLSRQTVQRWEEGSNRPSAAYVPAVAEWLQARPDEMAALLRDEDPPGQTDADIAIHLGRLERLFGELTRRQIEQDAEIRLLRQDITAMNRAMIEALAKRLGDG
jgi:transcriptional regulator with XRE-family HTH domain